MQVVLKSVQELLAKNEKSASRAILFRFLWDDFMPSNTIREDQLSKVMTSQILKFAILHVPCDSKVRIGPMSRRFPQLDTIIQ
ncbi:hypothetical protein NPIL_243621 [Nephila pilipes]|uniref:Uncharacterized protein n=1 Tax=Nephila pilipes TaxID=299642 RepID=A0A8X6UE35_NEPPI|nr:hypothetical protein NPIL_243621 [Nephila pilipes]